MFCVILFGLLWQDLIGQDSTKFASFELQLNYALLNELEFRRIEKDLHFNKIAQMTMQIENYEALVKLMRESNENMEEQLKESDRSWYDNFIFGAVLGIAATSVMVYLVK